MDESWPTTDSFTRSFRVSSFQDRSLQESSFQAGLWADESMEGVEAHTVEWAQKRGRQVPARFLRRYGVPAGGVLIVVGLAVAGASLIAS